MFEYIKGELTVKKVDYVALEVNGIAYKIFISLKTYEKLSDGTEKLFIYNNVKDKANKSLPNERFNFYFSRLFTAMNNFSNSEPSDKFVIDFDKKQIIDLKNNTNRIK